MEDVEITGEDRTEAAAQTTEEAGGEPGEDAQLGLRLGEDEEGAVRALSVQGPRAQPSLGHLQGEGNVVEEGHHGAGAGAGLHTRHLPPRVARVIGRGFLDVWKSLPLALLYHFSLNLTPGLGILSHSVVLYNPGESLGLQNINQTRGVFLLVFNVHNCN